VALFNSEISWQQQHKLLTGSEQVYIKQVHANLQAKCQLDMQELTDVLTPGKLQLTDAQRLERLDHLSTAMNDKYGFAVYFTTKCRKLAQQRQSDQQQKNTLKQLYGIKP
jgi:hypothetical protein